MTKAAGEAADKATSTTARTAKDVTCSSPVTEALGELVSALADRAVSAVTDKVSRSAERLNDYAVGGRGGDEGDGGGGLGAALTGAKKLAEGENPASAAVSAGASQLGDKVKKALGIGKGGGSKLTNIVESIDVGVPVELAYDQWTRFTDFPSFMKKVENVDQESDGKLTWKAQVLWSHRTWESTIIDQIPYERIIWRSKGDKGYVDGAVTFHELAPRLTRVLVVVEYHPQGLFERTGNLWRAQGRRVRLELKHFRRHVMTQSLLYADQVQGWHGRIRDGQVIDEEAEAEDTEGVDDETDYGSNDHDSDNYDSDNHDSDNYGDEDEDDGREADEDDEDQGDEDPEDEDPEDEDPEDEAAEDEDGAEEPAEERESERPRRAGTQRRRGGRR